MQLTTDLYKNFYKNKFDNLFRGHSECFDFAEHRLCRRHWKNRFQKHFVCAQCDIFLFLSCIKVENIKIYAGR